MPSHWQIKESDVPFEERIHLLEEKLLEVVNTTLNFFPEELWTMAWTKVSQDTHAGREDLILSFNKFVDEGKKAGFWKSWKSKSDLV